MKASYAYGPVTVSYSENEFDGAGSAVNTDQEVESYEIAYTVSDAISVSYGAEDIKTPDNAADQDIEVSGVVASYTAGGMTIGFINNQKDNANGGATDLEMNELMVTFAF